MAYYKIKKDTKDELYADIRISYKNSITGKYKIASKWFRNVDNLTEAKFKKYIEKEAFRYEEEANITFEEQNDKDKILTFKEFANEWLKTLEKTLSYNYYRRAVYTIDKFNDFLEKENLDKKPISEIKVRDVQLFLNQSLEERELVKPQCNTH